MTALTITAIIFALIGGYAFGYWHSLQHDRKAWRRVFGPELAGELDKQRKG
jgi:hypothetical protein